MGSGSSKEKQSNNFRTTPQHTSRSETKTKQQQQQQQPVTNTTQKNETFNNSSLRTNDSVLKPINGSTNNYENNNKPKPKSRIPEPFDDSDDDNTDDILSDNWRNSKNRKHEGNNRTDNSHRATRTWEPPKPSTEEYPETYAQRMQREQYKREQLLRQKTIYRDPEEWKASDQISQQSFDVDKFKEVNKTMPKTDIFGQMTTNDYSYRNQPDDDTYYTVNHNRKKSVPRYDVTEEELMNDIETNYY